MSNLAIYTCVAFALTILGGYFSLVGELKKDIAKLSELPAVTNLAELHADEWRLMRRVYLRGYIFIRHRQLANILFPAFATSCAVAVLLILAGITVSNTVGVAVQIFGFPPSEFGNLLIGLGSTLLIAYVLYFRVAVFRLIQNSSSLERLL